jgi:hypothetical protein
MVLAEVASAAIVPFHFGLAIRLDHRPALIAMLPGYAVSLAEVISVKTENGHKPETRLTGKSFQKGPPEISKGAGDHGNGPVSAITTY